MLSLEEFKDKIIDFNPKNNQIENQLYECFLEDSNGNGELLPYYEKFCTDVRKELGPDALMKYHIISQKYLHNLPKVMKSEYEAFICTQESRYYILIGAPREAIQYINRVIAMKDVSCHYLGACISYGLTIFYDAEMITYATRYYDALLALLKRPDLDEQHRFFLTITNMDILANFPSSKDKYLQARQAVEALDEKVVPNNIGKTLKRLHLFAVQFYQKDFEVRNDNANDLAKELSQIITSLFLISEVEDSTAYLFMPIFRKLAKYISNDELIEYVKRVAKSSSNILDKLVYYEFLINDCRVDYDYYPNIYSDYFRVLKTHRSSTKEVTQESLSSAVIEAELKAEYEHNILYDELTGLRNRTAYRQYIQEKENAGLDKDLAVVIVDINSLKNINDLYGHEVGDALLKTAAAHLHDSFVGFGKVFRTGGDEFVIFARGGRVRVFKAIAAATEKCEKEKFDSGATLALSVGAGYREDHPHSSLADLLKFADEEMYQAKKAYYINKQDRRAS